MYEKYLEELRISTKKDQSKQVVKMRIERCEGETSGCYEISCQCGSKIIESKKQRYAPKVYDAYYVDLRCSECGNVEERKILSSRARYKNLVRWNTTNDNEKTNKEG